MRISEQFYNVSKTPQIKQVRRWDRLLLRGYRYTSGEWQLICATHNLLKCWRSGKSVKH